MTRPILLSFLPCLLLPLSCKSVTGTSDVQDHINVTSDGQKSFVVWLDTRGNKDDSDDVVHYDQCNPIVIPSAAANRNCPGLKPMTDPISFDEYSGRLQKYVISQRTGPVAGNRAKEIVDKLSRLRQKIQGGQYTTAEMQSFQKDVNTLQAELDQLNMALTEDEKKLVVSLLEGLKQGQDVTFDEGEARYKLSQVPFQGSPAPGPVKTCQTAAQIRVHLNTKTTYPLARGGRADPDINSRFCVHVIQDGTKRLANGEPLKPEEQPANGIQIAIADVSYDNNGSSFEDAQAACAALTIGGKAAGTWVAPRSVNAEANPRETSNGRSLEAIGPYLGDKSWGREVVRSWWSSSVSLSFRAPAWYFDAVHTTVFRDGALGVRCIAGP